jgi:hypothetical protein
MKNCESQWTFRRNISPPSSELRSKPRKRNRMKQAALLYNPEDQGGTLLWNRYDLEVNKSDKTVLPIDLYISKTQTLFLAKPHKLQLKERVPEEICYFRTTKLRVQFKTLLGKGINDTLDVSERCGQTLGTSSTYQKKKSVSTCVRKHLICEL